MRLRTIVIICIVLAMLAVAFIGRVQPDQLSEAEAAFPAAARRIARRPEGGAGGRAGAWGAWRRQAPAGGTN